MNRCDNHGLTPRELDDVQRAESSGRPVVVFVHGLWLLSDSWDSWRERFEARGYATIAPDWPGAATVEQKPSAVPAPSLHAVTEHHAGVLKLLSSKPIVVGHSFGGLVAQQLAARGLAASTVAISPVPSRGVLRVPMSSFRATWPVLRNPANARRWVPLSFAQFRAVFANATDAEEARRLYDAHVVPGPGRPLFEAALANVNPRSAAKVDLTNPERGPMKIISAELDRIVPWSVACAAFRRQQRNPGHTEFFEMLDRGHSLVIDSGWEDVADVTLRFVHRTYESRPNADFEMPERIGSCCRI